MRFRSSPEVRGPSAAVQGARRCAGRSPARITCGPKLVPGMLSDSRGGYKGIGGRVMRSARRIMMFKPPCTLDDIGSNPDWESLSAARLTARSTCDYERGVDCIQGALRDL